MPELLNRVYRIPKRISNLNQGIQPRKGMRRVYRFDLGSFCYLIKYDCKKLDSTYYLSYFPRQIKLTILSSAKPTCKLRNYTFFAKLTTNTNNAVVTYLLIAKRDCSSLVYYVLVLGEKRWF